MNEALAVEVFEATNNVIRYGQQLLWYISVDCLVRPEDNRRRTNENVTAASKRKA